MRNQGLSRPRTISTPNQSDLDKRVDYGYNRDTERQFLLLTVITNNKTQISLGVY
jgi:hypothetical protein